MLNISKGVNLTLDEQGRIQAEGLKNLPNDQAIEIRQRIKDNRSAIVKYLNLWNRAWELADYVDGGDAVAPYEERAAKLPELNRMVERMRAIEARANGNDHCQDIPGTHADYFQAPAAWAPSATDQGDRDTCPACGQSRWWRKNELVSKWICSRCHPAAHGLEAIYEDC